MSVSVTLKYLRHSPRKIRPVAKLIVGKNLDQALNMTSIANNDSARFLNKALKMAQAAAKQKEFDPSEMKISQILANGGPKIKRMRPNARSYQNRYIKHLAHLTIIVDQEPAKKAEIVKPKEIKPEEKK